MAAGPRPVLLCVDDDVAVLDAVHADLRRQFGRQWRVVAASSGQDAMQLVDDRRLRDEPVALVIADQRMPGMTGTQLLAEVKQRYPDVRTVLLTAYADTDAAIEAINRIRLDHYVMKPWDPPEERLFPVVDELLEEWTATRAPQEAGIRVVGERWSAVSHTLRDYLARNQVPFRWIDVEDAPAADPLLAAVDRARLPLLVLDDGRVLADPSLADVATALALTQQSEVDYHDLVVVGGGPAGLAAAVYGGSEGLNTVLVEAEAPGGQAALSSRIENYLGFPSGISGSELARRAHAQARRFGTTVLAPHHAVELRREDPYRVVVLDDGTQLRCGAVILATGVQYRRLDAPGVDLLTGAGVYYGAASTEAPAMAGERVVVVGGANSAGQAALHLSRFAREVVVAIRGDTLALMSRYLVERIEATGHILVRTGVRVAAVEGDGRLQQVVLEDGAGARSVIDAAGMFVFIGAQPRTDWLDGAVVRDRRGFVLTGPALGPDRWGLARDPHLHETSLPGVMAVGDVRAQSVKRVASAVGEGSVAVSAVHAVLRGG